MHIHTPHSHAETHIVRVMQCVFTNMYTMRLAISFSQSHAHAAHTQLEQQ